MGNQTGAKKMRGDPVTPIDNLERIGCPCDAFIRCSTRLPYGMKVWKKMRKEACGDIAYDTQGIVPEEDIKKYVEKFGYMEKNSKWKYQNHFYKNVQRFKDKTRKVMTFPAIEESRIELEMQNLKAFNLIVNAGHYTAFQKSIILRSNIVRNGLTLRSDIYKDDTGKTIYSSKDLRPYSRQPMGLEWNIDHIQTRSKAGCNRFCNAALLARKDNIGKSDEGPGCPCAVVLEKGETKGALQEKFQYSGPKAKKTTLYDCGVFGTNKEAAKKNGKKHPESPLGTIDTYKDVCELDNPLHYIVDRKSILDSKLEKICDMKK